MRLVFSPESTHAFTNNFASPFLSYLKIDSDGLGWNLLSNPSPTISDQGFANSFSPDGKWVAAAAGNNSPFVEVWERAVDSDTLTSFTDNLPGLSDEVFTMAWSPCSQFFYVGEHSTPFGQMWIVKGEGFAEITDPTGLTGDRGSSVYSLKGDFIIITDDTTPFINPVPVTEGYDITTEFRVPLVCLDKTSGEIARIKAND